MNFNKQYSEYKSYFESELVKKIGEINSLDDTLKKAMEYSLLAGGKRLRPVLMIATAEALGIEKERVLGFALAIEFIHTYSLIHDDLPAMDNDDLRRGKPTNHKVFGEAMAILAGDALLNYAYELILRSACDNNSISAGRLLALYAGAFGMVGGQAIDILTEYTEKNEELLLKIHNGKTGRLLSACVLVPSCLASNLYFENLSKYGQNLGLLFQIVDDILDYTSNEQTLGKSVNKDQNQNKLTFVSLYGIEKAKELAKTYLDNAISAICNLEGFEFLIELVKFLLDRES